MAASSIAAAGTPVASSPQCGVQASSSGSSSSKPTVCAATKSRSTRPSRRRTCRSANASAASLPGNGCRCRSADAAVGVRTGSTTITAPGASGSHWEYACGADAAGFAPQTTMHAAVGGGGRIEAVERSAVDVVERDVAGLVTDRVRIDLGGAEPVAEPQREVIRDRRERAGVVRVEDRVRAPVVEERHAGAPRPRRAPRPSEIGSKRPSPFGPDPASGVVTRAAGSRQAPL